MKYTNEQLIEILDNIIETKSDYDKSDLTGASVSTSITHNYTQINYYLILFFGYKNRNSIKNKIPINEDLYNILSKAIPLKVKSLQKEVSEDDINDVLNIVSNIVSKSNRTIDSKSSNYNYNLNNSNLITKAYEKDDDFSLKNLTKYSSLDDEYKNALKEYLLLFEERSNKTIADHGATHKVLDVDNYFIQLEIKDYKYKNFALAYKSWNRSHIAKVTNGK